MPGTLEKETGYSLKKCRRQNFYQNTYFAERFGRNQMDEIENENLAKELLYMIKYIEKTGERIVYSKGLPQYFISDIMHFVWCLVFSGTWVGSGGLSQDS